MGVKGSKMTNDSVIIAALLVEKLSSLGAITSKRMFGGHGVFYEGKMFAMVDSKGLSYFKADAKLKEEFAKHDSIAHVKMPYTSIPDSVFNDLDKLLDWANKAIQLIKK